MTALSFARVSTPSRVTRLIAATAALSAAALAAAPLAAGAQPAPVGQAAGLMEAALQQGNGPLVDVVQPKLLLDGSSVFDEPAQRPVARLRDALTETMPHLTPDLRPLPDAADAAVIVNPEPSTLAMLAGAGALLGVVARRRRPTAG
jgi:hypothetical protein